MADAADDLASLFAVPADVSRQLAGADVRIAELSEAALRWGGWIEPVVLCARGLSADVRFQLDRQRRVLLFWTDEWTPLRGRFRLDLSPIPPDPAGGAEPLAPTASPGPARLLVPPGLPASPDAVNGGEKYLKPLFNLLDAHGALSEWEAAVRDGRLPAATVVDLPANPPADPEFGRVVALAGGSAAGVAAELATAAAGPDARRLRRRHLDLAPGFGATLSLTVQGLLEKDGWDASPTAQLARREDGWPFRCDVAAAGPEGPPGAGSESGLGRAVVVPRFDRIVADPAVRAGVLDAVRAGADRLADDLVDALPKLGKPPWGRQRLADYLRSPSHDRSAGVLRVPKEGDEPFAIVAFVDPLDGSGFRTVFRVDLDDPGPGTDVIVGPITAGPPAAPPVSVPAGVEPVFLGVFSAALNQYKAAGRTVRGSVSKGLDWVATGGSIWWTFFGGDGT